MVLFSAMTGIGLCMAHRVLFFLFPQIAQSTLGQMTAEEQSRILNSARTPAYFLYVGLIGPVLEELVFRGILFNCCSGKYGRWYPVFITALLFAVFHRNPVQFASAICMGLVLGSLLTLTGDIRITMMIHISNNVFSVMQSPFVKSGSEFSLSPAGIIASVLIGFLFLVWGFVQIKKGGPGGTHDADKGFRPAAAIGQSPCRHRQMIHCPAFFQIPGSKHRIYPSTHQYG